MNTTRQRARLHPSRVRTHIAPVIMTSDFDELGVCPRPRIVNQVRTSGNRGLPDGGTIGIHADVNRGEFLTHSSNEGHYPIDLLGDRDRITPARFNATDVNDLSTGVDAPSHPCQGCLVGKRCSLVIKRVGSAVNDRHHRW